MTYMFYFFEIKKNIWEKNRAWDCTKLFLFAKRREVYSCEP